MIVFENTCNLAGEIKDRQSRFPQCMGLAKVTIEGSRRLIKDVVEIYQAAEKEPDPKGAIALFCSILCRHATEKAKVVRYSETTGAPIEFEWVPAERWNGVIPQDCPLGIYLTERMLQGSQMRYRDVIITYEAEQMVYGWRGDDEWYPSTLRLSKPALLTL